MNFFLMKTFQMLFNNIFCKKETFLLFLMNNKINNMVNLSWNQIDKIKIQAFSQILISIYKGTKNKIDLNNLWIIIIIMKKIINF